MRTHIDASGAGPVPAGQDEPARMEGDRGLAEGIPARLSRGGPPVRPARRRCVSRSWPRSRTGGVIRPPRGSWARLRVGWSRAGCYSPTSWRDLSGLDEACLLISKVTTPLFMGLVYFFILTPTGLRLRVGTRFARGLSDGTHWVSRRKKVPGRAVHGQTILSPAGDKASGGTMANTSLVRELWDSCGCAKSGGCYH